MRIVPYRCIYVKMGQAVRPQRGGLRAGHGLRRVFHTVWEHLSRVRAAGLALSVSITPNGHLGEDVFETIRLAHSLSDAALKKMRDMGVIE